MFCLFRTMSLRAICSETPFPNTTAALSSTCCTAAIPWPKGVPAGPRSARYDMPGMGGLATSRAIRKDTDIAIIMRTVRNSEEDKVAARDAGADDFVTRPFSTPELMARIRAALRRVPSAQSSPKKVRVGEVIIDFEERRVVRENVSAHLTPKELDLLRYLTQHANQALSHRELLQAVWGPDYGDQVDYLRVFVKNLRKKMEPNPEQPQYITTEPWVGYRLKGNVESS